MLAAYVFTDVLHFMNYLLLIFKYAFSYEAIAIQIKRLKRVDCWLLMGRIIIFQFSVIILLLIL